MGAVLFSFLYFLEGVMEIEEIIKKIIMDVGEMPEATYWERRERNEKFSEDVFEKIFKNLSIKNKENSWGTNFLEVYKEIEPRILSVEGIQKYKDTLNDLVKVIDFRLMFKNAGINI